MWQTSGVIARVGFLQASVVEDVVSRSAWQLLRPIVVGDELSFTSQKDPLPGRPLAVEVHRETTNVRRDYLFLVPEMVEM